MLQMPFQKLNEAATAPQRKHPTDAGLDLTTTHDIHLPPGKTTQLHTGIAVAIPPNHMGLLFVRSSIGKRGITLTNSVGVIDADYRGEIIGMIRNDGHTVAHINKNERVLQLVITPCVAGDMVETSTLPNTLRGTGGFGSTGL